MIRKAKKSELKRLTQLYRDFKLEQSGFLIETFPGAKDLLEPEQCLAESILARFKCGMILVAEDDDEIIGFVCGSFYDRKWDLYKTVKFGKVEHLYVVRPHRGRGIGSKLLDGMMAWLKSEACTFVNIEVYNGNKADGLYHRHGFRPTYQVLRQML